MSFAKIYSAQANLTKATIISIEVDLSKGLHSFSIVGLPDKAVEESRDRLSAAIKNCGFTSPKSKNQKVVVSLAPADLKKEGPSFDVPMALAYLLASEDIRCNPENKLFLGELSLDGKLRPIRGVLPLTREAKEQGFTEIFVPFENAREAALIAGITVYPAETLKEIIDHINEKRGEGKSERPKIAPQPPTEISFDQELYDVDMADIYGQEGTKRGLEIAAAGGHNIAMYGPPGTGKTMLARAFRHLLPGLSFEHILEVSSIHSVAGQLQQDLIIQPPFRAPHHTSSYISIVGGGTFPKPGEITLAHRGVLFLDEFPEFERKVIDALRQPLEERTVTIARARGTNTFPAHVILVVAMNPCPCGNFGIRGKECSCTPSIVNRYQRKISGPVIDRIDIWTEVSAINHKALTERPTGGETTTDIRERIIKAREVQQQRFAEHTRTLHTNSEMNAREIQKFIKMDAFAKEILNATSERLGLSGRAHHRIMKLAQTIADLGQFEYVNKECILEALQYRPKKFN
jgi:magnesium chelatase family protein